MSTFIELPAPLSSDSIGPGYIVTDLFGDAASSSFSPHPDQQPEVHFKEQTLITESAHGGHDTTKSTSQRKDSVMLAAEESTHIFLAQPQPSFNALRNNIKTHAFLREAAVQQLPLFYITGVQLKQPSTRRDVAEASADAIRPPTHVTSSTTKVTAVQLSQVKCRVGAADEPHALDDLEYDWTYHALEDELQLSIGLGKVVTAEGIKEQEIQKDIDCMDEGWDYDVDEEDDENGLGGF